MTFEPGQVVMVEFPFSDRTGSKRRPALVLSTPAHQQATGHVVLCGVTSNTRESRFSVLINKSDFTSGALPVPSRIQVERLFTIEAARVDRKWGKLKPAVMAQVWKEFHGLFPPN